MQYNIPAYAYPTSLQPILNPRRPWDSLFPPWPLAPDLRSWLHGHPFLAFINEWGLMILGLLMLLGVLLVFSKTLFLLFGALIFGLLIEEDVLTPLYAQRVATVVVMSLIGYFSTNFSALLF